MKRKNLSLVFLFLSLSFLSSAQAEKLSDQKCIRAVIGEASNQGYQGMLAVAVGIRNRGTLKGVYGVKAKHVDREPSWVWDLAARAWKESEYNRIHTGYMWENIVAFGKPSWYHDVVEVYRYKDHVFYIEKKRG